MHCYINQTLSFNYKIKEPDTNPIEYGVASHTDKKEENTRGWDQNCVTEILLAVRIE